ncbi:MAG: hypothetical protein L0Z62_23445 [Gemmataceae bacterium]|nr:hypothetical protein [Gemmataceae bacterium]
MWAPILPARALRRGIYLVLGLGLPWLLSAPAAAYTQGQSSGTYLSQAFTRVTNNAGAARKLIGYGYADGLSILGGWISAGDKLEFDLRRLEIGTSHMIIAGGDNDAEDVDLEILDPNGRVVASDVRVAPDAVVEFVPRIKGSYRMRLTLYKARERLPCVCVATVLKKDGWNIPLRNLDETAAQLIRGLAAADEVVRKDGGKRLDLHKAKNQWALYGGVARQGEEVKVTNMTLGKGVRAFLGAGDKNAQDVDLFLLDRNERAIKSDTKVDPIASFVHEPQGDPHGLRVLNYRSTGPAVIMMAIFEVRD